MVFNDLELPLKVILATTIANISEMVHHRHTDTWLQWRTCV